MVLYHAEDTKEICKWEACGRTRESIISDLELPSYFGAVDEMQIIGMEVMNGLKGGETGECQLG